MGGSKNDEVVFFKSVDAPSNERPQRNMSSVSS